MNESMETCIKNCEECSRVCLETLTYSLEKGGEYAAPEHIRLLMDCAKICQTSADFMIRGSDNHPLVCGTCAEICLRCAEACERFDGDEQMERCAEVCRPCAESCRAMAGA